MKKQKVFEKWTFAAVVASLNSRDPLFGSLTMSMGVPTYREHVFEISGQSDEGKRQGEIWRRGGGCR